MKVALVYDRVNKFGGAERVLLALHEIFPNAPLYTSVYSSNTAKWARVFPQIHTSLLQKIPFAKENHEFLAPLMPFAFSLFNFDNYDLVISVTSEFAKNINVKGKHVCYCLTPTRYLWSHKDEYFKSPLINPIIKILRDVDKRAAYKPDLMVAISSEVQKRIKKHYGRDSQIIYPPVEVRKFKRNKSNKKYYLLVSRLVKYKKVDLAVKVFNKLGSPLVIVGTGREEKKLKKLAKENIKFTGFITEKQLGNYYSNAKALIFPQEEDFGIVAVEAQSFGIPVIAYRAGGAMDTIINKKTGIFFQRQTTQSLIKAITEFENNTFKKALIKANARRYSKPKFQKSILKVVKSL